ncbi:hypothetical protein LOTGIDRAFT_236297 [Lottia gigantea]|uniref:Laminin G domain-containing protein n=1 Tax=Lottia gigantea TaxID=225164 RepID=V4B726_LOTGI|nr:hypothetical protein LOTGIDRAFT_236297 [Lottia gigantea]ESO84329.1 hypothetical protein LOTGIDRAFT_236297 [Lottia gigantea]
MSAIRYSILVLLVVWSVSAYPAYTKNDRQLKMDMRAEMNNINRITTITPLVEKKVNKNNAVNCSTTHRTHKTDRNKFQVYYNKAWFDQVCQTGLMWNQTACRCEYSKGDAAPLRCPDYRDHGKNSSKYEQLVNRKWVVRDCNLAVSGLIWNQTMCRCVWGPDSEENPVVYSVKSPCDTMFNATFETGLVDHAKSSFIELNPGAILSLRQIQGKTSTRAAYFQDAYLTVWYFAGNEMSDSLNIEFSFKADEKPSTKDNYQIIMSNGCNVTELGYTTPSIAIGFRAADQSFLLAFETTNVRKAIVCTRDLLPYQWHKVSLIYEDGTLLLRVDGQPCIISEEFRGPVQKTSCPMTIGADPLEKESRYVGYLDDMTVSRYCKQFDEADVHIPKKKVPKVPERSDPIENKIDVFSALA